MRYEAKSPAELTEAQCRKALLQIQEILWWSVHRRGLAGAGWDPEKEWDADTSEAVSGVLSDLGLAPVEAQATDEDCRDIRVVVACRAADGSPAFFPCVVHAAQDDINEGWHYEQAYQLAGDAGYEVPSLGRLAYDEDEAPEWLLANLFPDYKPPEEKEDEQNDLAGGQHAGGEGEDRPAS